jgi:CoA:oxalate CoA-transferase
MARHCIRHPEIAVEYAVVTEVLRGVTVVDLTHAYAGPLCTHHLRRLGAEVLKIEEPERGDDFRRTPWFSYLNAGKSSVALDLKSDEGRESLSRLIASADVLVENYAPGVPARLGVDWDTVHVMNPDLVYCSIKGYGEEGPFSHYPAMESTVQAMSGISSMWTSEDTDPRDPGVAMADAFAGYVAFSAIVVALLERDRGERGKHVTVSMLEAALVLQTASVLSARDGGERFRRRNVQGRFMAKDRRIYVNLMFPKWYRAVCAIVSRPDLLEPPWNDPEHREAAGLEFVHELETSLAARTAEDWEREFTAAGVPASVVRTPEEILAHEHVTNSGLLVDVLDAAGRPVTVFDLPFRIDGERGAADFGPVPALGQHTDSVIPGRPAPPSGLAETNRQHQDA